MDKFYNVDSLRKKAIRKLPRPVCDYLEGGADDEKSLSNNISAFDRYQIVPRVLRDITGIDTKTLLFGREINMPLFLSPTGQTRLFHHQGELPVAAAAAEFGTFYVQSTFSSETIETISAVSDGPSAFQVYVLEDKTLNKEMIERAKAANIDALFLTVDSAVGGNRERDIRSGFTVPPQPTLQSLLQIAVKPAWAFGYLRSGGAVLGNLAGAPTMSNTNKDAFIDYMSRLIEHKLTWEMAADMISDWGKPFAIKGIMSVKDARRALEIGASAVIISNHGGRQMDCTPAPIELVREIRAAIGDELEIVVDGGIRRGSDMMKALAFGANACSIGRPYLYGLIVGGQSGVHKALTILQSEFLRNMALCGCRSLSDINEHLVRE
jgi:L-lactate dehydrogenase (cytochrome)